MFLKITRIAGVKSQLDLTKVSVGFLLLLSAGIISGCNSVSETTPPSKANHKNQHVLADFIYFERAHFNAIKKEISAGNPLYIQALEAVKQQADKALQQPLDSVMNKPKAGPSGDKHDYLSISPYFWPDPDKSDGMPWLYKDGQVNPKTRGIHTDQQRSSKFLKSLGTLSLAYSYTGSSAYAEKMRAQINNWLVDPATKMNPNLNYAQGMPGRNLGSSFGIIEWASVSNIVTAMELLKANNLVSSEFIASVDEWLNDYLIWLLTSDLGIHESTRKNNHGPWYDYQVVGIMLYLGESEQAKAYLATTRQRINEHFLADGSQPHELKRTKSVNYSSMNLQALVQLAYLGTKVGVNLWQHEGENGQSLPNGVAYFNPYLRGEKQWIYKQIWRTVDKAYELKTYPMLHITRAFFGADAVPEDIYNKVKPTLTPELLLSYRVH